jgi:glutathione S-transferase
MRLYGLAFEHRPWATFGDGDKIAPFNPLRRVPTLVLDGGEALIESTAILDYLDELVGSERAMIPARGPERRHVLKLCALATGLGDKAVSLVYERVLRKDHQSKIWVSRCEAQIGGVLEVMEKERAGIASPYWFGAALGHADIAVACVLRFTREAHPATVRCHALSGAVGPRRALRAASGVQRDRAGVAAAERGLSEPALSSFSPCGRRWRGRSPCRMRGLSPRIETSHPPSRSLSSGGAPRRPVGEGTFSHKGRREGESPTDLPDGRIAQIRVQSFSQKYFAFPVGQIKSTTRAIPSRKRGVAHVINAGRDAMDAGGARDVRAASAFAKASADWRKPRRSLWRRRARTAKSCGPDTPTLVSSFRGTQFSRERRWQQSPVTGESAE